MTELMKKMSGRLSALWSREDGQTMAEYAIILVVVAIVAVAGYKLLGQGILNGINDTNKNLPATTTTG